MCDMWSASSFCLPGRLGVLLTALCQTWPQRKIGSAKGAKWLGPAGPIIDGGHHGLVVGSGLYRFPFPFPTPNCCCYHNGDQLFCCNVVGNRIVIPLELKPLWPQYAPQPHEPEASNVMVSSGSCWSLGCIMATPFQ